MEFFYDQAPDVMRSCSMALGLLSSALGSYLAGALTWLVQEYSERLTGQQWLTNDLNLVRREMGGRDTRVLLICLRFLWHCCNIHPLPHLAQSLA